MTDPAAAYMDAIRKKKIKNLIKIVAKFAVITNKIMTNEQRASSGADSVSE